VRDHYGRLPRDRSLELREDSEESVFLLHAHDPAGGVQPAPRTEKDYQIAFNNACFHGKAKLEVPIQYGRIDLETNDYAIEGQGDLFPCKRI